MMTMFWKQTEVLVAPRCDRTKCPIGRVSFMLCDFHVNEKKGPGPPVFFHGDSPDPGLRLPPWLPRTRATLLPHEPPS